MSHLGCQLVSVRNQSHGAVFLLYDSYYVMGLFLALGHGKVFGAGRDSLGVGHDFIDGRQRCIADRFWCSFFFYRLASLLDISHGVSQREGLDLTHFQGWNDLDFLLHFRFRIFGTEEVLQSLLGDLEEANHTRLLLELSELVKNRLGFLYWFIRSVGRVVIVQGDLHRRARTGQHRLQLFDDEGDTRIPLNQYHSVASGGVQRQALGIHNSGNHDNLIHVWSHLMLRI